MCVCVCFQIYPSKLSATLWFRCVIRWRLLCLKSKPFGRKRSVRCGFADQNTKPAVMRTKPEEVHTNPEEVHSNMLELHLLWYDRTWVYSCFPIICSWRKPRKPLQVHFSLCQRFFWVVQLTWIYIIAALLLSRSAHLNIYYSCSSAKPFSSFEYVL